MANHFIEEFSTSKFQYIKWKDKYYWVVSKLANFFKVSKQSVEIRLTERNYYLRE
jgi:hypothetical protein